MKISYKNNSVEKFLIAANFITGTVVVATFVLLYGFDEPVMRPRTLHLIQIMSMLIFLAEKTIRFINAVSKRQFLRQSWVELPLLAGLVVSVMGSGQWFATETSAKAKMMALGIYLVTQVVLKACRSCVNLAASGKNPAKTLVITFLVLIVTGAGMLMLPKSCNTERTSFIDAIFTATSATCVTGLVVRDTGEDFSMMGKVVILTLIQLGGLGIVIFGVVLALLLGQALSVRESAAMQDLLSAQTLGKISRLIGFIIATTIIIESIGALCLFDMWDGAALTSQSCPRWFSSVFHSISAFCNAGFCLFNTSLIEYRSRWGVYAVIAPLIILGGLGFGVLYNISEVIIDKFKRTAKKIFPAKVHISPFQAGMPKKMGLQAKIVLTTSLLLIVVGTLALMIFGSNNESTVSGNFLTCLFQSITARTAGFNTVNIAAETSQSKFILIVLMLIGGSPASTAGGIKTVTLAVLIMVVYATLHKRNRVEIFKRSIRLVIVGRAVTIAILFAAVFLASTFALSFTEKQSGFPFEDIMFESASALGTVGLSTGITPALTTAGKCIIIITMLIGRLGPLTLLASMTFNLKPAGYEYPDEPIVVG